MTASRWLSFALGLTLAAPIPAYAYGTLGFHRAPEHRASTTAPKATSPPEAGLWRPSYAPSHRLLEIEGLTRNPDDCVKYGCIGNN